MSTISINTIAARVFLAIMFNSMLAACGAPNTTTRPRKSSWADQSGYRCEIQ